MHHVFFWDWSLPWFRGICLVIPEIRGDTIHAQPTHLFDLTTNAMPSYDHLQQPVETLPQNIARTVN